VPDTPGVGVRSVRMGAVQEERCSGVASSYILGGPGAELKSAVLVEWVCWVPGSLVGAAMCWEVVDTDGRMNQLTLWQCTFGCAVRPAKVVRTGRKTRALSALRQIKQHTDVLGGAGHLPRLAYLPYHPEIS